MLVFDDSSTEIPDSGRNVRGGDWQIQANESSGNDPFCSPGSVR